MGVPVEEEVARHRSRGAKKHEDSGIPIWVGSVVLVHVVLSTAAVVVALFNPALLGVDGEDVNATARTFAQYAAAPFAVVAMLQLGLLRLKARRALGILTDVLAWIQLLDAAVAARSGHWTLTAILLVMGVLYLLVSANLCNAPFWKRAAWTRRGARINEHQF